MRFIKDVLASRKELLKQADIIYENVLNYPELGIMNIFNYVKDDEVVNRYLGVFEAPKDLPDKHFLYEVLGTLKNEWLTQIVMSQQLKEIKQLMINKYGRPLRQARSSLRRFNPFHISLLSNEKAKLSLLKQKSLGRKQPKKRKRYEISGYEEKEKTGNQFMQALSNMSFREENVIMKSPPGKRLQLY